MAKISIIIPVFNSEKTLSRCIDSIRNQTTNDWELILVNDGSADDSAKICKKYSDIDNRITTINTDNRGPGHARNLGIEHASCEYIAFVDSDDRVCKDTYAKCISIMDNKDCDILLFGIITEMYDEIKNQVTNRICDHVPEFDIKSQEEFRNQFINIYRQCDLNSPCNKIYKKSLIVKHNLRFPDMRRMQDGVFNLRYFDKIASFHSIKANYYVRTWHSSAFQSKKMPNTIIECMIKHNNEIANMLKRWGKYDHDAILVIGEEFSENILTVVLDYSDVDSTSIKEVASHIKKINSNKDIQNFLKEYSKEKKLRKLEIAMLLRLNLLLALYAKYKKHMR